MYENSLSVTGEQEALSPPLRWSARTSLYSHSVVWVFLASVLPSETEKHALMVPDFNVSLQIVLTFRSSPHFCD